MLNSYESTTPKHHGGLQSNWRLIATLKLSVIVLIVVIGALVFGNSRKKQQAKTGFGSLITTGIDGTILSIPYQQTLYKHFGNAINPQVVVPVKTTIGYKEMKFLIDSGAVVSALPKTLAEDLGADLTNLPRITIEGFAGQKTFAYRGEFVIKLGKEEIVIPVVFSENSGASNILGRIGFFDQFNINFNAETQNIEISKKRQV